MSMVPVKFLWPYRLDPDEEIAAQARPDADSADRTGGADLAAGHRTGDLHLAEQAGDAP